MSVLRVIRWVGVCVLALILTLVLVIGVTVFFVVRAPIPDYGGELHVRGLSAPVTVYRDGYGIPQIYASSSEDLFRAQGYVQAQDRFWEMDFRRHVTAGRLSELFGKSQVETDAYIRTMGWRRVAEREFDLLTPDARRWLRAYSDGVNAWIADHSGSRASLEYSVLWLQNRGYHIEKWSPVDSLAWLKAMAWDLRENMTDEISRAQLLGAGLSRDQVDELYPAYPSDRNAPILPSGTVVNGTFRVTPEAPGSAAGDPADAVDPAAANAAREVAGALAGRQTQHALATVKDALERLPQLLGANGPGIGSNSWVIAASRTTTGKPILANDPHLGPMMPSIWYQMGLHCTSVGPQCPFDVAGYTFSGMPGVVIGHNDRIAWGFTNLGADVSDLYLEKVTGDSYEIDGRSRPLTIRTETIKVAGGKLVNITVRSTGHGPLLSDRDDDLKQLGKTSSFDDKGVPTRQADRPRTAYAVALRWTALDPHPTLDALFTLNTAANWNDFRAAAKLFAVPAQNMVYADVDGHIGYQSPGDIPVRQNGDGRWPAPGWNSMFDWSGRIPFDSLPSELDPPRGYIATANQEVVGGRYPYLLTEDWDYGYRSQRIADMINLAPGKVDVADVERMQFDSTNANAAKLVPYLEKVHLSAATERAAKLFNNWDYSQPANSAAAAYFNAVWRHVLARTFDELPKDNKPDGDGRWFEVMRGLLADPTSPWWDERRTTETETRDDVLASAMNDATTELTHRLGGDPASWRWGDLHTLTIKNQSFGESGIGPIEWLFNRGPYATTGGPSLVNATGWTAPDGYRVDWVPSMRMVLDMSDLDSSRWVNLTGASGHAFSKHYADQVELWRTGKTTPMRWDPGTIRQEARYQQTLQPR